MARGWRTVLVLLTSAAIVVMLAPLAWLARPPTTPEATTTPGLLLNTFAVALCASVLALGFGAATANVIVEASPRWRAALLAFATMPLAIPPFVSAIAWIEILNRGGAPPYTAHGALAALGVSEPTAALLESSWVLALSFYPCVTWSLALARARRPREVEDEARLLAGARGLRLLALPLTAPAIATGVLLVFFCPPPSLA